MIKGKTFDPELLKVFTRTVFDLSEAAQNEMVFINPDKSITINNVYIVWIEGSSAGTGIAIQIGNDTTGDDYFTVDSAISQSAGDVNVINSNTVVSAGQPIYINHVGSKDGAGTCFVAFSYSTN